MQPIIEGLLTALSPANIPPLILGVLTGIVVGALPGLTSSIGIVILLPLTFSMGNAQSMIMLAASLCGAMYGGSISAILINTPGTSAAAMTAMDGHPMARAGRGGEALGMAAFASWFGGTISVICLLLIARPLAILASSFGPPEYFLLAVFGLTILVSLSKEDPVNGILSSAIGLLMGTVGLDIFDGTKRFTFGTLTLISGLPLVPTMIAMLSLPVVFRLVYSSDKSLLSENAKLSSRIFPSLQEIRRLLPTLLRSSLIGVFIGVLPGVGGSIASFLAYDTEKKIKRMDLGTGIIDGVAAAESANNGVTGGAIATMLTLGIPGNPSTAVILGALIMKGITPGLQLFESGNSMAYTFIMSLFPANLIMLLFGILGARYLAKIVKCPNQVLVSIIIVLMVVGAFAVNNRIFDVFLLIGFGIFFFILKAAGISAMPAVLGFILGPYAEKGIRQTAIISGNDFTVFFRRPVCVALIILILLSVAAPFLLRSPSETRRRLM